MKGALLTFGLCGLLVYQFSGAFETESHALISRAAFQESSLNDPSEGGVLNRLGLNRLDPATPFTPNWIENGESEYFTDGGVDPDSSALLAPEAFENCQMNEFRVDTIPIPGRLFDDTVYPIGAISGPEILLPIQNWIVRGAIREDDLGTLFTLTTTVNCRLEFMFSSSLYPSTEVRVFNHFFDPFKNTAMPKCPVGSDCLKSVDWALGNVDSFTTIPQEDASRRNHYTYKDARNTMWLALTREKSKKESQLYSSGDRDKDARDRLRLWATTFRSLGDVVHLLEDTGQPQHTRSDPHSILQSPEQQAFENYINARILGRSLTTTNGWVRDFFPFGYNGRLAAIDFGSYPIASFATPERFFSTRGDDWNVLSRDGLADYTNRGFFTGGTLPPDADHIYPLKGFKDAAGNFINGYGAVSVPCGGYEATGTPIEEIKCTHYVHEVPDVVAPQYAAVIDKLPDGFTLPNVPLASESIFSAEMFQGVSSPNVASYEFVISPTELDTIGNLTVPRAVGYAAGMLNYFFRGRLELSSPPGGLYGVVDQGVPHIVESGVPVTGSGQIFGFKTIRVRAKNATPDITESGSQHFVPQTIGDRGGEGHAAGQLVAIVRYNRNSCYQADLKGELVKIPDASGVPTTSTVPSGCDISAGRTDHSEISVSQPVHVASDGSLRPNGGETNSCANLGSLNTGVDSSFPDCTNESALLEFNFSDDPIPVNATDVFLQVAYRGPIGQEQDAIAVGIKDILEPNFYTVFNNTDWSIIDDMWTPSDQVPTPPGPFEAKPNVEEYICYEDQLIGQLAPLQELGPAQFARIGVLADLQYLAIGSISRIASQTLRKHTVDGYQLPSVRQAGYDEQYSSLPYQPDPIPFYGRGTVLGFDYGQSYWQSGEHTSAQYHKLVNNTPDLGVTSGGPIATQLVMQFTSKPDPLCQLYFAPGTHLEKAARDQTGHANAAGVISGQ